MSSLVKSVFVIIGCVTLSVFLYYNLFGYRGNKGAIYTACQQAEKPLSSYYDRFTRQPAEAWDKSDAESLINSESSSDILGHTSILDEAEIDTWSTGEF